EYAVLARRENAATDGERSARGIRAAVWGGREHGRSRPHGAARAGEEHSRPGAPEHHGTQENPWSPGSIAGGPVLRRGSRGRAANSGRGSPEQAGAPGGRTPGRGARIVRTALPAVARSPGARVPDRHDAHQHVHDVERADRPFLSRNRRSGWTPSGFASPE